MVLPWARTPREIRTLPDAVRGLRGESEEPDNAVIGLAGKSEKSDNAVIGLAGESETPDNAVIGLAGKSETPDNAVIGLAGKSETPDNAVIGLAGKSKKPDNAVIGLVRKAQKLRREVFAASCTIGTQCLGMIRIKMRSRRLPHDPLTQGGATLTLGFGIEPFQGSTVAAQATQGRAKR